MKKTILALFVVTLISLTTKAQDDNSYKNAIGIRLGSSVPTVKSGVTLKHFFGNNAVEGILSFGNGTALCALYEIHKPINAVENLQWFYGAGGYVGFGNNTNNFGGAGIVGLDYKFTGIPLNLSLDWKPEFNIVPKIGFEGSGLGFSARFTL
jgi:hypothetical protein